MTEKKWVSCCRGRRSNCPEVAKGENGRVHIKDDYGNEVALLKEDALRLKDLPEIGKVAIYGNGPIPVKLTRVELDDVLATLEELE